VALIPVGFKGFLLLIPVGFDLGTKIFNPGTKIFDPGIQIFDPGWGSTGSTVDGVEGVDSGPYSCFIPGFPLAYSCWI